MAKQTGYTCDRPDCGKFVVADQLPVNWLALRVNATNGDAKTNTFEVCSNYCLAVLAIERAEADGTPVKGRKAAAKKDPDAPSRLTPEGRESMIRNGKHSSHKRYHIGAGRVDEDCEWCLEDLIARDEADRLAGVKA